MEFDVWSNEKSELEVHLYFDLTYWALPVAIYWLWDNDCHTGIQNSFSVKLLCFGITLEYWKWGKD
jgi:hypothetical protein